MNGPGPAAVGWVQDMLGCEVVVVCGLREGGAPWLLDAGGRRVVLRTGRGADAATMRVERIGLEFAAAAGIPVSRLIAADLDREPPLLLVEAVDGTSTIPVEAPVGRLRTLGAAAATLHRLPVPDNAGLPRRSRPIADVNFDRLRAESPPQPLLVHAERVMREQRPDDREGFVHGDLWQGNALWRGDELAALIDWDCAGVGPAGVDLGSLRCDAATAFGLDAPEHVLRGWEEAAGRPAEHVPYWDIVAALSTPPDMGWFTAAAVDQGRTDLTREQLVHRRDDFIAAALRDLGGLPAGDS